MQRIAKARRPFAQMFYSRFSLALVAFSLFGVRSVARACPGDCDGSGDTSPPEIQRGVEIALGQHDPGDCLACDTNGSNGVEIDELVAAVNVSVDGCPATPTPSRSASPTPTVTSGPVITPIFPASYRNTFVEVRNCRFSAEHGGVAIRVLANPIAVQPYLQNQAELPVGSIVVKEEFTSSDCSDDTKLVRWRAMRKESPGFDSEDGDWHWQWVNRNRNVLFNDKTTCIGCHRAPVCVARDFMCTLASTGPTLPPLRVVFDGIPPALLAASGTSATNVFVSGADIHDGLGSYVLHYDGTCWKRLPTGASGTLWWISVRPIDGSLYMVGEGGLVLRYDLASGQFEKQETPGDATLFGIWGESSHSLWAVGHNLDETAALWHYDGTSWQIVDVSNLVAGGTPGLFKIWGRHENDIYAVGLAGTMLHYDGTAWSAMASHTNRPLFGVNGNDSIVVATGGFNDGVVVEKGEAEFVDRSPPGLQQINGVYVQPDGSAVGVGVGTAMALRDSNGWVATSAGLDTRGDFHAVWIDPDGGLWAVGGNLSTSLSDGLLVYGGTRSLPTEIHTDGTCGEGE